MGLIPRLMAHNFGPRWFAIIILEIFLSQKKRFFYGNNDWKTANFVSFDSGDFKIIVHDDYSHKNHDYVIATLGHHAMVKILTEFYFLGKHPNIGK